jgi:hypothetical protein
VEVAAALAGATLAEREQAAEPAVGGAVHGVDQHRRALARPVPQHQLATHNQAHASLLRRLVRSHDPGQAVAIGDGQRLDP